MSRAPDSKLPNFPHRRRNPLTGDWVLVSAQRTNRPWEGSRERPAIARLPAYDPTCYLCPGNERANGKHNPQYADTFVFTNDFPALLPETPPGGTDHELFRIEHEPGTSRVICFSPRHDLTLADMDVADVTTVVDVWAEQTEKLGQDYTWVQVFENRGAAMGASNPHPHGQVWAGASLPDIPAAEDHHQRVYFAAHGRTLLGDYLAAELEDAARIVVANDEWVALVPFWAVWPFETLIVPRRPMARMPDSTPGERLGLAELLSTLLSAYDRVFDSPFPYSMGWHGAPYTGEAIDAWHLHAHVYPPLLRSASVRKFMVGYELLAGVQRDLTPESAAARLRSLVQEAVA